MQKVIQGGITRVITDAALNDSSKDFVVPDGKNWELLLASVSLVASATVGNRRITMQILSGATVIYSAPAGAVQAASATVAYDFAPALGQPSSVVAGRLGVGIPQSLVIGGGMTVRFLDTTAVDAAADDMTCNLMVREY